MKRYWIYRSLQGHMWIEDTKHGEFWTWMADKDHWHDTSAYDLPLQKFTLFYLDDSDFDELVRIHAKNTRQ